MIDRYYATSEGMSDDPYMIESKDGDVCYWSDVYPIVILLEQIINSSRKVPGTDYLVDGALIEDARKILKGKV